jgi:hypothetical protein
VVQPFFLSCFPLAALKGGPRGRLYPIKMGTGWLKSKKASRGLRPGSLLVS